MGCTALRANKEHRGRRGSRQIRSPNREFVGAPQKAEGILILRWCVLQVHEPLITIS
jgi:hypothetical protein